MRVLQHDQCGEGLVGIARVAEGRPDGVRIHRAVEARRDGSGGRPDHHRVTARLIEDGVRLGLGDDLAAARHVGHQAHQVAHRAAGHEEAGLLAGQLGGPFLQGDDRRVVAEDVVAELGLRHRPSHLGRGLRDRVGAQVDAGGTHRRASIRSAAGPPVHRVRRLIAGQAASHLLPSPGHADPWCSGPTCQPVTLEIAGSNPVGSASPSRFSAGRRRDRPPGCARRRGRRAG